MTTLLERIVGREIEEESPPETLTETTQETLDGDPDTDPEPVPRSAGYSLAPVVAKVTPTMRKKIAVELEAYIGMAALPIVMRDPHCGSALHENAKPIAEAIAQILSRYPEIAAKFLATGMLGDWVKLLMVTTPVVQAVWAHHGPGAQQDQGVNDDALPDGFDPFRPGS